MSEDVFTDMLEDDSEQEEFEAAMRPTPITDAARRYCMGRLHPKEWADYIAKVCADLERQLATVTSDFNEQVDRRHDLERQLAEERELRESGERIWRDQRDGLMRCVESRNKEIDDARAQLAIADEQRDRLVTALERTASDFIAFRNIARENGIVGTLGLESLELAATALAAVKGGAL